MKDYVVKRYKSQAAYQRDARCMLARGYTVLNVTSEQPRAGCLRLITLGIFTLLWPPKPVLVVSYRLVG